ncbi:hypothetical protein ONZ45_g12683 [Pleurotus djamor]|nr:hypothetical protein ONZ45_g12683 [Pleurotus djamor]
MSFWRLWGTSSAKSFYLSIAFALSSTYNKRLVENSSYATWNAILVRLCKNHPELFLICPQYGLYVSPNDQMDAADADASFDSVRTTADSQAKGVFVDNSIILPALEVKDKSVANTVYEYFATILSRKPWVVERNLRVNTAIVPVLVEQKRPPSRHCTLNVYVKRVQDLISEAQAQADAQAACLFSMSKFGSQDAVILVATTGGWWSFRLETREAEEDDTFDFEQYMASMRAYELKREPDEADYAEDAGSEFMSRGEAAKKTRRVTKKEIIKEAGKGPFSVEDIDRYWRKVEKSPFCQNENDRVPYRAGWTKPMRLGTLVSDNYLGWIEGYLNALADTEVENRS